MMRAVLQISSTNNSIAPIVLGLSHKHETARCIPNFKEKGFVHCQGGSHPGSSPIRVELPVKNRVPYNGTSESDAASLAQTQEGIGIVKFLNGKVFFITGATGFLAKVLIEKLLRTVPDVGKIYVFIKAKNTDIALKRLKNEIINSEIFKRLQKIHGKSYEGFMLSKLIPVAGNISESNLGLDENSTIMIAENVDIIVHSAATTNFHERYDVALDINTMGPRRVMDLAKNCKKLNLFLHISTAYVSGERKGITMERPFREGETISIVDDGDNPIPPLDIEAELNLARRLSKEGFTAQKMKEAGLERARKYGWQDTYAFTKAMGEMLLGRMRGDFPVVILRPTIIESAYRDPFPGWIQGNRMLDPLFVHYGKGKFLGFPADPNGVFDVVPVDMVVNATLAAIAKHGTTRKAGTSVYQVASSVANPVMVGQVFDFCHQHFTRQPYIDVEGRPINVEPFQIFDSVDAFLTNIRRDIIHKNKIDSSKIQRFCTKIVAYASNLASAYAPYTFHGGRFDNSNTSLLLDSMSEEEREAFCFDVRSIDWKDYICNIHLPGLRKHVLKEKRH